MLIKKSFETASSTAWQLINMQLSFSATFVGFLTFIFYHVDSGAQEIAQSVKLPAIYHVWSEDSSESKPVISMEELEKCVGKGIKLRQKYEGFNSESESLEKETGEFDVLVKDISAQRQTLESEAIALNAETTRMNNLTAEMEKQKNDLAVLAASMRLDADTIKNLNARIVSHNSHAKLHNANLDLLKERVNQHQNEQSIFNGKILPIRDRLEAFNIKAESFKSRKSEFDALRKSFEDKCTGERQLVR